MPWDVMGGVARRAWARNEHSVETCAEYNLKHSDLGHITLPYTVDDKLIERTLGH
jgi:urocanate hydratase